MDRVRRAMMDFRFCSKSVCSISSVCVEPALRKGIITSDSIRAETLRRCCAIPSYPFKSLQWKNRYYDFFRRKVMEEMKMK